VSGSGPWRGCPGPCRSLAVSPHSEPAGKEGIIQQEAISKMRGAGKRVRGRESEKN